MTQLSVSISEKQAFAVVRDFLLSILGETVEVVRGQDNRVPEPKVEDFVVLTPLFRERLETNIDDYFDATFTGSISGTTMTITDVLQGVLTLGSTMFGIGLADNTRIIKFLTGAGGVGTYAVNNAQTFLSGKLAAGVKTAEQRVKMTIQMDVHGPNSADNAHVISTLFRDEFACDKFAESGMAVFPLYVDDPKQIPFQNEEQQIEYRWSIDALVQCNPIVGVPQQFADELEIDSIIDVDVVYPPA